MVNIINTVIEKTIRAPLVLAASASPGLAARPAALVAGNSSCAHVSCAHTGRLCRGSVAPGGILQAPGGILQAPGGILQAPGGTLQAPGRILY